MLDVGVQVFFTRVAIQPSSCNTIKKNKNADESVHGKGCPASASSGIQEPRSMS